MRRIDLHVTINDESIAVLSCRMSQVEAKSHQTQLIYLTQPHMCLSIYGKYRDFIEIVSPDLVIVISSAHASVFSDASGLCGVQ